jgi:hypothetical protein
MYRKAKGCVVRDGTRGGLGGEELKVTTSSSNKQAKKSSQPAGCGWCRKWGKRRGKKGEPPRLLGRAKLGDRLGSFRNGVLGQFTG